MARLTKQRMTKQKKLILDIVKGTTSHPTADWVYQKAREVMPNISLGTVYRNLRFLVEMGEIMELNYTNSYSRFDGNPSNHYHFVCQTCGEVSDLELTSHPDIDVLIKDKDLVVFSHRLEFYGLCSKCQSD